MTSFQVNSIGKIQVKNGEMFIELEKKYIPALEGFSHINVIWWFDGVDTEQMRSTVEISKPYKKGPSLMGIFATRSPIRLNPIALTAVEVIHIDYNKGVLQIAYIDANNGSPVIDLKPYTPSLDRVETPHVPQWCSHWPKSLEKSGDFEWENEFNF